MVIFQVILPIVSHKKSQYIFYYYAFSDVQVGNIVLVRIRGKYKVGVVGQIQHINNEFYCKDKNVYGTNADSKKVFKINKIEAVVFENDSRISHNQYARFFEFITWVAKFNITSIGAVLSHAIPSFVCREDLLNMLVKCGENESIVKNFDNKYLRNDASNNAKYELSHLQKNALNEILQSEKSTILLYGVTGSGKTSVYLHYIIQVLENNCHSGQVLILVPEISNAFSLYNVIKFFSMDAVYIWHSGISAEKYKTKIWNAVCCGNSCIVIGVRAAVFLPFVNLQCVVVDEEHSSFYQQTEQEPFYHARDMAVKLAGIHECKCVLASATPSSETFNNYQQGLYQCVSIMDKFSNTQKTDIMLCKSDYSEIISSEILENVDQSLHRKEQVIFFLNKIGYHDVLYCKCCKKSFMCKKCSCFLTYHKKSNVLLCRYCDYRYSFHGNCDHCFGQVESFRFGVEKVFDLLRARYPENRIAMFHSSVPNRNELLKDIIQGKIDIIIGTQIIISSHNIPNVSLMVMLDADYCLYSIEFHMREKFYQMAFQALGRLGRFNTKGRFIVSTSVKQSVEHNNTPCILDTLNKHYHHFLIDELVLRNIMKMPPSVRLCVFYIKNKDRDTCARIANVIFNRLINSPNIQKVLRPLEPNVSKVENYFRFRVVALIDRVSVHKFLDSMTHEIYEIRDSYDYVSVCMNANAILY